MFKVGNGKTLTDTDFSSELPHFLTKVIRAEA